ncbi:MFS transporter [Ensifer adhaerens]|jgi:MFS family permease/quinol monooxygenase YgiN|uniref:MFS transporter n=1 Tax=Ensifer adhaerens TaxID=106592 RepID=A0A9Q8YF96_ENSAD|nr:MULTISPECIES: MFS transporter [Ensifer]KSV63180.1 MFS transporter [Sinorhizobium sp. GW3]MBD9524142.1 MFS transporter [Ensifer sp. ENS02]MBD9598000.1 MFS transporter [Ensifer sp. ENS05]USJ27853.1 MFS transporter [Ensifer adhaerens]UTV40612.1 MFS transporter [Ensifer adhaerens]
MSDKKSVGGSFAPLAQPVFAVLWTATVLGNTGSFMRDVASSWLMTDLSASTAAVAMVQAAGTLPIFLLAIPAGVLTDILDRRKFLIAVQILLASVSISLMVLAQTGMLSVSALIGLTFLGGIGAALMGPTWQAIVPELVKREDVKSAVALNSLGINIARSIGPAAGGLLLAAFGAGVTYGADVASYIIVIAALLWWPRAKSANDALSENFFGAFRAGLRYTRASRPLHVVLLRAAIFFAFASAVWALLPLVARQLLGGDASFYGILLGAVGAGAIAGALVMPKLRDRLSADGLLLGAAVVTAIVMAVLSLSLPKWVAIIALLFLGGAWITALTTLNGAAQAVLPNWVRGRGLAVYLTVFNGAMTAGSLGWGAVGEAAGIQGTLLIGAAGLLAAGFIMHRLKLPAGDVDLVPSNHWPEPLVAEPVAHDRGPVLILIEYQVEKHHRRAFLHALDTLSQERRRDGAYGWGVTEDSADPEKMVEWFMVESWAEHLRQHQRVSNADADLQGKVLTYHKGPEKPVVRHFLSINRPGQA